MCLSFILVKFDSFFELAHVMSSQLHPQYACELAYLLI